MDLANRCHLRGVWNYYFPFVFTMYIRHLALTASVSVLHDTYILPYFRYMLRSQCRTSLRNMPWACAAYIGLASHRSNSGVGAKRTIPGITNQHILVNNSRRLKSEVERCDGTTEGSTKPHIQPRDRPPPQGVRILHVGFNQPVPARYHLGRDKASIRCKGSSASEKVPVVTFSDASANVRPPGFPEGW